MRVVGLPRLSYQISKAALAHVESGAQERLCWLGCWQAIRRKGVPGLEAARALGLPRSTLQHESSDMHPAEVLGNLLANAARHSPESSTIRVSAAPGDLHASVWVSDKGRGIPAESLPHLFQKFSRIEGDEQGGDIELGLAVCKGMWRRKGVGYGPRAMGRVLAHASPSPFQRSKRRGSFLRYRPLSSPPDPRVGGCGEQVRILSDSPPASNTNPKGAAWYVPEAGLNVVQILNNPKPIFEAEYIHRPDGHLLGVYFSCLLPEGY